MKETERHTARRHVAIALAKLGIGGAYAASTTDEEFREGIDSIIDAALLPVAHLVRERPTEYACHVVLVTDKSSILGISLFSEPEPSMMGYSTHLLARITSRESYAAAHDEAERLISGDQYAFAGELCMGSRGAYRDNRPAWKRADVGPRQSTKCRRSACQQQGRYPHRDTADGLYCGACARVINAANRYVAPQGLIATNLLELKMLVAEQMDRGAQRTELLAFTRRLLDAIAPNAVAEQVIEDIVALRGP